MKEDLIDEREVNVMDTENLEEIISEVLEDSTVEFAYLHGSYAKGREHEDSDLDIAVFVDGKIGLRQRSKLMGELTKKTGIETDVSVLNNADVRFQNQVLKEGKLVYSRDEQKRLKFEQSVLRRYLDMKPFIAEYDRQVRKRVTG